MYILRNLEEEAYGESTSEEEYEDTTAPPPSEQNPPKTTSNLPTSTSSLLYGAPAFEKEEAESENPLFEGGAGTPQVQATEQFQDVAMNTEDPTQQLRPLRVEPIRIQPPRFRCPCQRADFARLQSGASRTRRPRA